MEMVRAKAMQAKVGIDAYDVVHVRPVAHTVKANSDRRVPAVGVEAASSDQRGVHLFAASARVHRPPPVVRVPV